MSCRTAAISAVLSLCASSDGLAAEWERGKGSGRAGAAERPSAEAAVAEESEEGKAEDRTEVFFMDKSVGPAKIKYFKLELHTTGLKKYNTYLTVRTHCQVTSFLYAF